ncbi:MAG: TolC family protein [Bacteroidetes bacterium]|nr:TolC family protein [Bacteroidota bacterium]
MKQLLCFLLFLMSISLLAQVPDSVSLGWCQQEAIQNYPMIRQKELLKKITEERIRNLQTNYLPQINLNGQVTYQSEVTEIPIKVPFVTIPSMDKDQYKITLDLNQTVYDGGMTRQQKQLERAGLEADQQNLEAELYKIKERVNQLYFGVLLLQENRKILESLLDDLNQKLSGLTSGVKNGTVLESQADVLKAEKLKVEQQLTELNISRQAGLLMLGEFLNKTLPVGQAFILPAPAETGTLSENKRLEPLVMELQQKRLDVSKQLSGSKYLPRVFAFAQAGYGKPGLNMLNSEFQSFWLVGAKVSWNLWNWNQLKNERQIIDFQKDVIITQKETFDKNLKISLENQSAEIEKFQSMLSRDEEIIDLRHKITLSSASQLENGVITSSDYVTELNNETQARLNRENHRIQLVKARVDYLTMKGVY